MSYRREEKSTNWKQPVRRYEQINHNTLQLTEKAINGIFFC